MEAAIKFYSCNFEPVDWENPAGNNKWIDNKQEAIASKLRFNTASLNARNMDSLYQSIAQYVFVIGGGDRWITAENCKGEINGDTITIKYTPQIRHATVGETAPALICLELSKLKYRAYKKMKIVFKQI